LSSSFKIAQVAAAHGIRGEVKLVCFLDNPKDLPRYSPLITKQGKEYPFTITGHTNDHILLKLEGITDRNMAETLRGTEFFAEAAKRPALSENEYYHQDLIGLEAVLENGEAAGKIIAVHNFGAGDIIELSANGEEIMLPFKAPFVGDIKNGKITVTLPEYLGDEEEEQE